MQCIPQEAACLIIKNRLAICSQGTAGDLACSADVPNLLWGFACHLVVRRKKGFAAPFTGKGDPSARDGTYLCNVNIIPFPICDSGDYLFHLSAISGHRTPSHEIIMILYTIETDLPTEARCGTDRRDTKIKGYTFPHPLPLRATTP